MTDGFFFKQTGGALAHLASIEKEEEMNAIFAYMQESTDPGEPPRAYWIGLTKDAAGE